jgi:hypothetical protein
MTVRACVAKSFPDLQVGRSLIVADGDPGANGVR